MKGVLEVVDGSGSGGGASGGGGNGDGGNAQEDDSSAAMGSSGDGGVGGLVVTGLALAFVSPALFATFLRNRDLDEHPDAPER